jgi:hypothetical protein
MSEYTPDTDEVKSAYDSFMIEFRDDYNGEKQFDRWLAQHEAKVRDDYRDRLVDALRDFNRALDVTDPFQWGFVTAVDELMKVLDSVKERADDSFATLYR